MVFLGLEVQYREEDSSEFRRTKTPGRCARPVDGDGCGCGTRSSKRGPDKSRRWADFLVARGHMHQRLSI